MKGCLVVHWPAFWRLAKLDCLFRENISVQLNLRIRGLCVNLPLVAKLQAAAKQIEAKHLASLEVMVRLQKHLLGHGSETAEPQQDSSPRGGQ